MTHAPDTSASTPWRQPVWMAALALLACSAIGARARINFGSAVPPGMDAGYYAVQARSLLEHGRLQWSDVPLVFMLDAALAKLAMVTCGWSADDATMWSTRMVDSVAQPMVAVVIFAATFMWRGGRQAAIPAAMAAAAVATMSGPILRMTGDFEKQSFAMVFMAASWIAAARALAAATRAQAIRRSVATLALLALTAFSHAGTFAAASLGMSLTMATWAMRGGVSRGRLPQIGAITIALGALMLGTVWVLAPTKAAALVQAPTKLFDGAGPGDMAMMPPTPGGMHGPGGMRGPPGPPGFAWPGTVVWLAALLGAAHALRWAARRTAREHGDARCARADLSLCIGLTLTSAFLTCPLLNPDYGMRLSIMAPVPLGLVLAYLLSMHAEAMSGVRGWGTAMSPMLCGAVLVVSVASAAVGGRGPLGMPRVSREGLAELRAWREQVNTDGRVVVAARHGVEFWAAFALECDARLDRLKPTDFDRYRRLYVLVQKRGGDPRDMRGPPDDAPPGMGGSATRVPDGSTVALEGRWFTLYEVPPSARMQIETEADTPTQASPPRVRDGRRPPR